MNGKRESVARANARIRRLVVEVRALVDAHHAKPVPPEYPPISCTEGCAHAATGCCSLITLLEQSEAEFILDRNLATVERLLPRIVDVSERLAASGIDAAEVAQMFGDKDREQATAERYHELGIPCVFLDEHNRCGIYQDRPLACRTHFVLSPPEECDATGVNLRHATLDRGTRIEAQAMLIRAIVRTAVRRLVFGTLPQLLLAAYRERQR